MTTMLKAMQKGDETQPLNCKPRLLFEPSFLMRMTMGLINFSLLKASRSEASFIQGLKPAELAARLKTIHELKDPVMISLDMSAYDSHAAKIMIDHIDSTMADLICDILIETELAPYIPQMQETFRKTVYTFVAGLKGEHKFPLIGKLKGTTFSGLPHRTTLGNTWRTIFMVKYALRNFHKDEYRLFCAGDDILIAVSRPRLNELYAEMDKLFAKGEPEEPAQFGLGQVVKFYKASDHLAEFLSKVVLLDDHGVTVTRKPDRVRIMSNFMNIKSLLTKEQHNIAVNYSHYYGAGTDPINKNAYIKPAMRSVRLTEEIAEKIKHNIYTPTVSPKLWWYLTEFSPEFFSSYYHTTLVIPELIKISEWENLPPKFNASL